MYINHPTPLGALGKKKKTNRKEVFFAQKINELEQARAIAELEDATPEQIAHAQSLIDQYIAIIASYESAERRKGKKFVSKLKKAQEKKIKLFAKLKLPSFKAHAKNIERRERAKDINLSIKKLYQEKATPEREEQIRVLNSELQIIAAKNKKYMKQGKIVAAIVSIVVGIFTFGGGTVAVQGAVQAIKQGAIGLAKKILTSAVVKALAGGANKKDADKAMEAINDLERFPPDPNLTSIDSMISDSQTKKLASKQKLPWIVLAGTIAALLSIAA